MKTKSLIPLLFALTSAGLAHAQDDAKIIDPKAKAIIEKSIEAIGGKDALAKIKTRTSIGAIEMPEAGMSLKMVVKQKAPLMFHSKAVIPEVMTIEQGFDGKEGWSKDSIQGSRKLEGAELAQAKEGAALFFEAQLLEDLTEAKILPDSKVGEQNCDVIKAKTKDEMTKTLYFDKETHLLTRVITKAAVGPEGEMEMDMIASDYKEIDGVKIAYTMEMKVGAQKIVMKFSEIEHNQEIADDVFKMKQ